MRERCHSIHAYTHTLIHSYTSTHTQGSREGGQRRNSRHERDVHEGALTTTRCTSLPLSLLKDREERRSMEEGSRGRRRRALSITDRPGQRGKEEGRKEEGLLYHTITPLYGCHCRSPWIFRSQEAHILKQNGYTQTRKEAEHTHTPCIVAVSLGRSC